MHAVLCCNWKQRVNGQDWFDLVWYVGRKVPLNLTHLEACMLQSGHLEPETTLDETSLRRLLLEKIEKLPITNAQEDVRRYLRNPVDIEIWSRDFFVAVSRQLICEKTGSRKNGV
ncbi:MAG TPA: hypothetical protein ENN66_10725 [Proteobacteria bacterium]|nr:hypothetical protein [Pseudomonadota bacterium]